jgi:hypothetical protein
MEEMNVLKINDDDYDDEVNLERKSIDIRPQYIINII